MRLIAGFWPKLGGVKPSRPNLGELVKICENHRESAIGCHGAAMGRVELRIASGCFFGEVIFGRRDRGGVGGTFIAEVACGLGDFVVDTGEQADDGEAAGEW